VSVCCVSVMRVMCECCEWCRREVLMSWLDFYLLHKYNRKSCCVWEKIYLKLLRRTSLVRCRPICANLAVIKPLCIETCEMRHASCHLFLASSGSSRVSVSELLEKYRSTGMVVRPAITPKLYSGNFVEIASSIAVAKARSHYFNATRYRSAVLHRRPKGPNQLRTPSNSCGTIFYLFFLLVFPTSIVFVCCDTYFTST